MQNFSYMGWSSIFVFFFSWRPQPYPNTDTQKTGSLRIGTVDTRISLEESRSALLYDYGHGFYRFFQGGAGMSTECHDLSHRDCPCSAIPESVDNV
jgi:hypothetical protein